MVVATASDTLGLLEAYSQAGDGKAREQLVANYAPLVRRLCRRFHRSVESQEDLFQVGVIGLLNAIEKFDPRYGTSFASLAIPEVLGAILNHLRDHGSLIKLPRALRQVWLKAERVSEKVAPGLGRWPTVAEVAQASGLPEGDLDTAAHLARAQEPRSLDRSMESGDGGGGTLGELIGREDERFDNALDRITVEAALLTLSDREREIVRLRFYGGLTQRQAASRINVSQMHISRLERGALRKLRLRLETGADEAQKRVETSGSHES